MLFFSQLCFILTKISIQINIKIIFFKCKKLLTLMNQLMVGFLTNQLVIVNTNIIRLAMQTFLNLFFQLPFLTSSSQEFYCWHIIQYQLTIILYKMFKSAPIIIIQCLQKVDPLSQF
ncbi:hypothetical protein TTHERM_000442269 (macronuclear) [Tetrahymena thermophila SB210]|uniref:Uncharacterized protein n=1 Tax=Tetrahymena thermophila (strain SB210) TaxID=312017 RepID=W7X9G2_TETTS|nr:hypothetical protein TTHERM_000442269 [Tetrahymena thermophila SB210]EWS73997.1 hypothetical protein TTHERM_000442269 [Tetrahymena thermophila SB210]|eukprot:XP_012653459.1 hypothetical protein TTHERM_000442269 [Tetrahymena thermophila SB210]